MEFKHGEDFNHITETDVFTSIIPVSFFSRLLHSPALRAVGTMAGATGVGQILIFATLPLLTRLYDPAAFGLYSLITAFVGVASVGVCLSLELAIVQAPSDRAADELCTAAIFSLPVTLVLSAVILTALIGAGLFGYDNLPWLAIPIVSVMVGLNGLYIATRYRLLREQRYAILARATLAQSLGRALGPLVWFLLFPGWAGLSFGEITGRMLGVRRLLCSIWPQLRTIALNSSFVGWWSIVRRERRYTGMLLVTVLIDSCASLLIAPMLAGAYGAKAAGEYFLVATVLVAPSALIGTAAADVLHTRGVQLKEADPEKLLAFLVRAALLLLLAGCAIYLPVYFFAPLIFPLFFGSKWMMAAPIAQALTPFMIIAFVASPCSRLLLVLNRIGLKVISDLVRLIGIISVITLATALDVPFITSMWLIGWFLAVAYSLYFSFTLLAVYYASSESK